MNFITATFLSILFMIYTPVRPPALGPADIPFTYDGTQVNYEILSYKEVEPDTILLSHWKAIEPDGDSVTFSSNITSDPDAFYHENPIQTSQDPADPSGVSVIHQQDWDCKWVSEGIRYIDITVTDSLGGTDNRTVLINVRTVPVNQPPVLQP